jgi:hypothetical protein
LVEIKINLLNKFKVNSLTYLNNQKIKATILLLCAISFSSYCIPLTISGQVFAQAQINPNPNQNNGGFGNNQQSPGFNPQQQSPGFNPQQQQGPSSGSGYLTYQSPLGFSIQYPAGAQVNETQNGVKFDYSGVGIMSVRVDTLPQSMGLSDYTQRNINIVSQVFPNAQHVEQGDASIAGQPDHYVVFTEMQPVPGGQQVPVLITIAWTIVGNTGYRLMFVSSNPDSPSFHGMLHFGLRSFQVGTSQQQPQQQPGFGQQQLQPQQQPLQ